MKLKQILLGVIIGIILANGIFVVAEETLSVTPNPFKITVNGEEKKIEGYNINGSTYFKLRDIGNEVGFSVDFKEDTIMIDSTENTVNVVSSVDNQYDYITFDGVEYIFSPDVDEFIRDKTKRMWSFAYSTNPNGAWTDENGSRCFLFKMKKREGSNVPTETEESFEIPCVFIDGLPYLTRETFENEILARINAE